MNQKVADERWIDAENLKTAIEMMKKSDYALLTETQTVYAEIGQSCELTEMGPNIFKGILVMIWQKDFAYASLFNYQ